MNLPTEDEIIDFTLKTLSINEFRKIDTKAIKLNFDLGKEHTVFVNNSLEKAFRKDLIIFGGNSHSNAKLTEFGETILENGGWVNTVHSLEFLENPIKKNTNAKPSKNPVIKSRLSRLLLNPWVIGFSFALLAAILNADRVMRFINNIIDNI
ncbi:hypothetical protein [Flavobacterium sp. N2270]|uniref:hypothetical protein n=1 Tax=Flavobacterium sp. N2270 TaxID=2986831 RepID=UPI0022257093|nr:hypothetical protein [Flavobacterium sp. N2270]